MIEPESPKIVVEISRLEKSFALDGTEVKVLRGIDISLKSGESIGIVGPSGSGKSTLLHILGLLERPSSGDYLFEGRPVRELSEAEKAFVRLNRIGFIFQFHHLMPEFTAIENVMLPALMNNVPHETAAARAEQLLQKVGLKERLKHRPGELSGGEQQRVALARALVNKPALLLADEPTGNLDADSAIRMMELLTESRVETGATLVLVTHNERMALKTDSLLIMEDGLLRRSMGDS
jgi:lipoprotein-releasing system ATP-binding protein